MGVDGFRMGMYGLEVRGWGFGGLRLQGLGLGIGVRGWGLEFRVWGLGGKV